MLYSEFGSYSEPCQISTMKLFCENSLRLLAGFSIRPWFKIKTICPFLSFLHPPSALPLRFHKILIPLFNLLRTFQLFSIGRLMNFPENVLLCRSCLLLKNYSCSLFSLKSWFHFTTSSFFITNTVSEIIFTFSFNLL